MDNAVGILTACAYPATDEAVIRGLCTAFAVFLGVAGIKLAALVLPAKNQFSRLRGEHEAAVLDLAHIKGCPSCVDQHKGIDNFNALLFYGVRSFPFRIEEYPRPARSARAGMLIEIYFFHSMRKLTYLPPVSARSTVPS